MASRDELRAPPPRQLGHRGHLSGGAAAQHLAAAGLGRSLPPGVAVAGHHLLVSVSTAPRGLAGDLWRRHSPRRAHRFALGRARAGAAADRLGDAQAAPADPRVPVVAADAGGIPAELALQLRAVLGRRHARLYPGRVAALDAGAHHQPVVALEHAAPRHVAAALPGQLTWRASASAMNGWSAINSRCASSWWAASA